ncbi:MAG: dihydrolipoyl dehydrogenase [Candidatus Omnitrophica bacterium]|nr:dihydrolipoyl dehydrogenase [Candidatus Omnitrophota bacterium]
MQYDLVVIGAGWAGFNAAIRAKELGLKVAIAEKNKPGGTCLNLGCIPTKTLLQSAKIYSSIKKAKNFCIEATTPTVNFSQIQKRKELIIQQLQSGISLMLKGIDLLSGPAQILSADTVEVAGQKLNTRFILIACGSRPHMPQAIANLDPRPLTSDELLEIKELPKSLLVIGGGVIGCEFASLFNALGSSASIVELMPRILPGLDQEIARKLEGVFKKRGIKISTNTDASAINLADYQMSICCIGRAPDTDGLAIDQVGIKLDNGKIIVDQNLRTNIANIYAAGDCTGRSMLAHAASYQGVLAVENMVHLSDPKKADGLIPSCIFTDPEIASIGLSEEEALAQGKEIAVHKLDFLTSSMARILDETEGFIKIISTKNTQELLGASIIGPRATELISVLTVAMQNKITALQLKNTIFAHPTLSEIIPEALRR